MQQSDIWTVVGTLVVALTSSKAWDYWKVRTQAVQVEKEADRADQNIYRDDLRVKIDEYREELRALYVKREKELFEMQEKIRELSEELSAMRVKVEFLEKENAELELRRRPNGCTGKRQFTINKFCILHRHK